MQILKIWKFWKFWKIETFSMENLCCMDVNFLRTVHTKFHTKSWVCSLKNGWVIANSMPIFCMDVLFVGTVDMNFYAKSGFCSSKNVSVIANSMNHRIFLHGFPCRFFFAWMPIFLDGPYKFPCKILII